MKNYYPNVRTLEELKSEYKRLAKLYHPDCGGTDEEMAMINHQYDELAKVLPKTNAKGETYQPKQREIPEDFRNAVMAVMRMAGVELELCGCWLWATGNTKPYRAEFKAAGYQWSGNKNAWYWHEPGYKKQGKKIYTLDEIRDMHGSRRVNTKQQPDPLPT